MLLSCNASLKLSYLRDICLSALQTETGKAFFFSSPFHRSLCFWFFLVFSTARKWTASRGSSLDPCKTLKMEFASCCFVSLCKCKSTEIQWGIRFRRWRLKNLLSISRDRMPCSSVLYFRLERQNNEFTFY